MIIKSLHLKAILITALGVLLMSLESLFIKLTSISALTFSFYIGVFMFLSLNFILFTTKKAEAVKVYKTGLLPIILCGFLFGSANIFFISSIKTTSVANTVMILATAPLFSSFFSYLIYREKSTKNVFVSSFFIFIGLFIIFYSQLSTGDLLGNIYALLCVCFFSLAFVVLAKYKQADRFAIGAISGFFTAIISFVFMTNFNLDTNTLMILLFAGLLISPISRVLIGIGTKSLPATEISLLMIIETVMAPIWVWLFLNEIPSNSTLIGGFIILSTLLINSIYLLKVNKSKVS